MELAAAAGSLTKLSCEIVVALYELRRDINRLDEDLAGLHREVEGFSTTLKGFEHTWAANKDNPDLYAGPNRALWASVRENIDSGHGTLRRLDDELKNVKRTRMRGVFERPATAIRLNHAKPAITTYRQQIHSYNVAMQGGVQMLNLCLLLERRSSMPEIDQNLSAFDEQIERIERQIDGGRRTGEEASVSEDETLTPEREREYEQMVLGLKHLAVSARSVHDRATTAVTTWRSTVRGDNSDAKSRSVWSESIQGDPLSDEKRTRIGDWIPQPAISEENQTDSSRRDTVTTGITFSSSRESEGSESDEEASNTDMNRQLAQQADSLARSNLIFGNYAKAEMFLHKLGDLQAKGVNYGDAKLTRLRLACALAIQGRWNDPKVEETIDAVMSSGKRGYSVSAYHFLHAYAMRCSFDGNHEKAIAAARKALSGKKNSLPRAGVRDVEGHPSYQAGLKLLAEICEAGGEAVEAELWLGMLALDSPVRRETLLRTGENEAREAMRRSLLDVLSSSGIAPPPGMPAASSPPSPALGLDAGSSKSSIGVALDGTESVNLLHQAIASDDVRTAEMLLNRSVDPSAVNTRAVGSAQDRGHAEIMTPLRRAVLLDRVRMAELLVRWGAQLRPGSSAEDTPFTEAAEEGRVEMVQALLKCQLDGRQLRDAILRAAKRGHGPVVRSLFQNCGPSAWVDSSGKTILHSAVEAQDLAAVETILGQHVHSKEIVDRKDWGERTPLHRAALCGDERIARALLLFGADANQVDSDRNTPFHLAAERGHRKVLQELQERAPVPAGMSLEEARRTPSTSSAGLASRTASPKAETPSRSASRKSSRTYTGGFTFVPMQMIPSEEAGSSASQASVASDATATQSVAGDVPRSKSKKGFFHRSAKNSGWFASSK